MTSQGEECLMKEIKTLQIEIEKKYQQYHLDQKPFMVVKADSGTYGMGVLMLKDAAEIKALNRKARANMSIGKGGQKITRVIIQEGVPTYEVIGPHKSVAEPVIYMIGQHVIGGFYRVHTKKGIDENLNSPGMSFEPLAFANPCNIPDVDDLPDACQNRFYAYGVISRLAWIAAAKEMGEAPS